jgi:hypothetical protein
VESASGIAFIRSAVPTLKTARGQLDSGVKEVFTIHLAEGTGPRARRYVF